MVSVSRLAYTPRAGLLDCQKPELGRATEMMIAFGEARGGVDLCFASSQAASRKSRPVDAT
ncbi:hypothetical protein E4U42_006796 [Claviceps africana]|uniref:Uncharacterized protein n=1 Tax=Claviceps africana TaxID=83212 RepID=A0A8K0J3W8_9HYPO|nr:hypothetical protein E4U42_006796 [Claviceps africana]